MFLEPKPIFVPVTEPNAAVTWRSRKGCWESIHVILSSSYSFKTVFSGKFMTFRKLENVKILLQNVTCERKAVKHMEVVPEQTF